MTNSSPTDSNTLYSKIELGPSASRDGDVAQRPRRKTRQKQPAQPGPAQSNTRQASVSSSPVTRQNSKQAKTSSGDYLRIIPLGGIEEVGKNMTVYETPDDIIVVDCGLMFPDDELLGVDIVIPDYSYLVANKEKIRGVVITHAHEDHIGALPYFLRDINVPVYGTKLTIGLIKAKLREFMSVDNLPLTVIAPGVPFRLGGFTVEPINVNHSIPDAVAFAITSSQGTVIHTGDFKIDYSPISDKPINLMRFGEFGAEGVLALLSDSTNAERLGYTPTEQKVGESLERIIAGAKDKRIIIASFASNIQRIQRICDLAKSIGRKIAMSGRSMINYTSIAADLGYLKIDSDTLIDISEIGNYPDSELMILTTGSQGEPMSALSRMASATHRQVSITPSDLIIISATPIPGNERLVNKTVNALLKWGSEVIYESMYEVHVSGHACQEEIKIMLKLTSPKYFIPVHGEFKHLIKNARLAANIGIPENNILIPEIGNVIEFSGGRVSRDKTVASGRVLVDGSGVGDVGSVVLRDRKHLAEDGLIIAVINISKTTGELLTHPEIISRGFVYVKESEPLIDEAQDMLADFVASYTKEHKHDYSGLKTRTRDALNTHFYQRTKRSPMILPILNVV